MSFFNGGQLGVNTQWASHSRKCLRVQGNSAWLCGKAQKRGEWRKGETEGGREVFGQEELRTVVEVASFVHTD